MDEFGKERKKELMVVMKIEIENYGGEMKMKVEEVNGDRYEENMIKNLIIEIIE